jgi:hypothetical protein
MIMSTYFYVDIRELVNSDVNLNTDCIGLNLRNSGRCHCRLSTPNRAAAAYAIKEIKCLKSTENLWYQLGEAASRLLCRRHLNQRVQVQEQWQRTLIPPRTKSTTSMPGSFPNDDEDFAAFSERLEDKTAWMRDVEEQRRAAEAERAEEKKRIAEAKEKRRAAQAKQEEEKRRAAQAEAERKQEEENKRQQRKAKEREARSKEEERQERGRQEKERQEEERRNKERQEKERQEQQRREKEQQERQRKSQEQAAHSERIRQKAQKAREEREKQERERLQKEREEWDRIWTKYQETWTAFKGESPNTSTRIAHSDIWI